MKNANMFSQHGVLKFHFQQRFLLSSLLLSLLNRFLLSLFIGKIDIAPF